MPIGCGRPASRPGLRGLRGRPAARLGLLALTVGLLLAGCMPASLWGQPTALPSETATATLPATATPTTTPVWFPPTATFTPLPAINRAVTTPDVSPSYGALAFRDDFQKPEQWQLGRIGGGSAALGQSELALAVTLPNGYLYSLRQETALGDFYLEITASPSICRAGDEYGLLLRFKSLGDFLRFGLTCRGEARLERLSGGSASAPKPAGFYGAVPPGAPSSSRLGVWAKGRELRFYVNGELLFSVRETELLRGAIGVYARAGSDQPLTVNFSELAVYDN
ncbi:MAG: hypothetical protein ACKOC5_13510 [Chloroflexota bacterium]